MFLSRRGEGVAGSSVMATEDRCCRYGMYRVRSVSPVEPGDTELPRLTSDTVLRRTAGAESSSLVCGFERRSPPCIKVPNSFEPDAPDPRGPRGVLRISFDGSVVLNPYDVRTYVGKFVLYSEMHVTCGTDPHEKWTTFHSRARPRAEMC